MFTVAAPSDQDYDDDDEDDDDEEDDDEEDEDDDEYDDSTDDDDEDYEVGRGAAGSKKNTANKAQNDRKLNVSWIN